MDFHLAKGKYLGESLENSVVMINDNKLFAIWAADRNTKYNSESMWKVYEISDIRI